MRPAPVREGASDIVVIVVVVIVEEVVVVVVEVVVVVVVFINISLFISIVVIVIVVVIIIIIIARSPCQDSDMFICCYLCTVRLLLVLFSLEGQNLIFVEWPNSRLNNLRFGF